MFAGKSVRRRAASMEAAKLEKRRGRFKKNIENVKNGTIGSEFTAVNIHEICNIKCLNSCYSGLSGMNEAASPRR